MFFVYVIKSLKNNRFYVGHTNDVARRLLEHNSGLSKYTSISKPFELIFSEVFTTRLEAVQRELFLKSGKGREWLKNLLNRAVA